MKPIPFKIDRNDRSNLPEQLASRFRMAIRNGYYKPGERLPSFGEIVKKLGVSIRAPRDAMKILVSENLVRSRPRIGCEVMARGEKVWKGRVIGVMCAAFEGSYHMSVLAGAIRKAIIAAGYSFIPVTVDRKSNGRPDFSQLDAMMKEPVDFVIAIHPDDHIAKRIVRYGVPALAHVDVQKATGLDIVRFFSVRDILRLAREVNLAGIRSVLLVEYADMQGVDAVLERRGLEVEKILIRPREGFGYLEDIKRKSFSTLRARLSPGGGRPDLIVFTDDFVAFGGLMALVELGIKVPHDMKVLTMSNKGFAPVFPVSLARVEVDPIARGAAVAEVALAKLEGRSFRGRLPKPVFIPGDSLPPPRRQSASAGAH